MIPAQEEPRSFDDAEALQPEKVTFTEEVQGEIAEPIGDLPVYQSRSKKSKKKASCCGERYT